MNGYRFRVRKGAGVQKPAYNPASAVIFKPVERISIVGAGIIGLASAWRLAQRGVAVTLFDAADCGGEASWAGAGMLAPGGEFAEDGELARMALESLRIYPGFVAELETESGVSIDFRRSGAIEVAYSEPEAAELGLRAKKQAGFGIPSDSCTHQGRPARFYPLDAVVDPRDVTRALRIACERRGVKLRTHEAVSHLPDGTLVTAGAWSSSLLGDKAPQVIPVRGHLVSWDLEPGFLQPILRHGTTYLLQRRSGVLIAGATKERVGFDRTLNPAAVSELATAAGELLPALAHQPPTDAWIGFRPFIEGEVPFVGQVGDARLWAACGHYRNGILLAPETAARVATMLTG